MIGNGRKEEEGKTAAARAAHRLWCVPALEAGARRREEVHDEHSARRQVDPVRVQRDLGQRGQLQAVPQEDLAPGRQGHQDPPQNGRPHGRAPQPRLWCAPLQGGRVGSGGCARR